jgi:hypothetical protein
MKISQMIRALEESKEMYGNINIGILIQLEDGTLSDMDMDNSEIYFNYEQYEDGDKLSIQNFPY